MELTNPAVDGETRTIFIRDVFPSRGFPCLACLSWRPSFIMITPHLFPAKFHLTAISFWITSLRWLLGLIGERLKLLFMLLTSYVSVVVIEFSSALDKFIMSKWMLQQGLSLLYDIRISGVFFPFCWIVSSCLPLYLHCPLVRFSNKHFCAFFYVDLAL